MVRLILFLIFTGLIWLCGCGKPEKATGPGTVAQTNAMKVFRVKGIVQEVKTAEKSVTIKHEEIPGYMPAMTMPFEVKNTNELAGLTPGDVVTFRMTATDKEGWIDEIKKTGTIPARDMTPQMR